MRQTIVAVLLLGSPVLQRKLPGTPPSSPAIPPRRSHTPIRLKGGAAARRPSTPTSVRNPSTPNLLRSTSKGMSYYLFESRILTYVYNSPSLLRTLFCNKYFKPCQL